MDTISKIFLISALSISAASLVFGIILFFAVGGIVIGLILPWMWFLNILLAMPLLIFLEKGLKDGDLPAFLYGFLVIFFLLWLSFIAVLVFIWFIVSILLLAVLISMEKRFRDKEFPIFRCVIFSIISMLWSLYMVFIWI